MRARTKPNWGDILPGDLVSLYAMHCAGCYKIGIARNPKSRLTDIQLANPFEVSLILTRTVRHEYAHLVETAVHQALCIHHIRGEWFRCELAQIKQAVRRAIDIAERVLPRHHRSEADAALIAEKIQRARAMQEAGTELAILRINNVVSAKSVRAVYPYPGKSNEKKAVGDE